MTERALIPFTLGLTPSEETVQQPVLSPRQQKELLDIIGSYGVKLTDKRVVQAISEVAGDAIFRALGDKGQSFLTPKDRLKPLFRRGLEIREDLRSRAETLLNLSVRNQNTYAELVGPLALPASLIHAANTDRRGFAMTADLTAVQQVVMMGEERLTFVDPWARMGLAALPETLKPVSLEQFPTVAERVKIIRNMITSFIFRGNFSPLISVAELKDFVTKAPSFFSEEARELFLEQMHVNSPQERSYLEALYAQTRAPFKLYTTLPADDNPKGIEDFYRRYMRDLLLMHPALEEVQIIINPEKASEGTPNLWDGGRVVGEYKLPKPELLSQALRQAQARGDTFTAATLRAGTKTWIWFEETRKTHDAKIKSAEAKLAERRRLFSDILNPDFPLPKEAYFIRYTTQAEAQATALFTRRETEILGAVIKNMHVKQKELDSYEQSLNTQYGENWPQLLEMPRTVFLERLLKEKKQSGNKNRVINRRLSALEELLAIDVFWAGQDKFPQGILRKDRRIARNRLTKELEATQQFLSQPDEAVNLFSEDAFNAEALRDFLAPYFRRKRAPGLPDPVKPYYKLWSGLYSKAIYEIVSSGRVMQTPKRLDLKTVLPDILKQRVHLLQFALQTLEEKDRLLTEQRAAQVELEEAADLTRPLPKKASWSKNEAKSYIKEVKASKLPSLKGTTLDELAKAIPKMMSFINVHATAVLPDRITGRGALERWLNRKIRDIERLHPDMTKSYQRYIYFFREMLGFLGHPLIPLPEENSADWLGKNSFLRAWQARVDLAYAVCYKSRALKQSQEASREYEVIMRDTFGESLARELESRKKALGDLRSRNLEGELLGKMRNHNLVLEA